MITRDAAVRAAGRHIALARARRDALPPALAARAAWQHGGPSVREIEALIYQQRQQVKSPAA